MMSLKNATPLVMLCILSVAECLTLDCPSNVCIGAEVQLTCQSNAQNLIGLSWTHNGKNVLQDPRYNVKPDVENGVSTLTFIISPFDNDTTISCIEVGGSEDRENCDLFVDPIPPVTNVIYDGETRTLSWKEPPCLPKDYRYSTAIDDGNTTTVVNTTDLSLTIDNIFTCTNFNVSVTVVNCGLNDTCNTAFTSIPTLYYFKLQDQEGQGIQLSNGVEYMNTGNVCFSLKLEAYSNRFCPGQFYLSNSSNSSNLSGISFSVNQTKFWKADVLAKICDEGEPPAIATAVIRNKANTSEQVEITVFNYGVHDKDPIMQWNGGVVNVSSCLSMKDNTSLTGTECYSEGVLFKSDWPGFTIFDHDNTVALHVFIITIQAQSSSSYYYTSPLFGLRPPSSSVSGLNTTNSFTNGNGGGDGGTGNSTIVPFLSIIVPVVSLAIILTVIIVAIAMYCWRRSKCKRVDLEAKNRESTVVKVEEDLPKKDDPTNIVDNASGELVTRPNWNLPPQNKDNEYEHGSSHKDTNETELDLFTNNRETNRRKDLPKYQTSRKVDDVHEEQTTTKTAPEKFVDTQL